MASANRPTWIHVTLVLSVIVNIAFIVVVYVFTGDLREAKAGNVAAVADVKKHVKELRSKEEQLDAVKGLVGHPFEEIGVADDQNPNTVLGAMNDDMKKLGGPLGQKTYKATLHKMRGELNSITEDRDSNRDESERLNDTNQTLMSQYQAEVDVAKEAQEKAESDLQELVTNKDEEIGVKDNQIEGLQAERRELRNEMEEQQDAHRNETKSLTERIVVLSDTNDQLREELDSAKKVSFEVADGTIQWVDHRSMLVWINLGTADKLKKGTTFSVYSKAHQGIGRGAEDIKGAIEVTRLLGSHQAEARIIDDDFLEPLAAGDPIYTPLWNPGRTEKVAVVGFIDLDGDGESDREEFRRIVATSGAEISVEVDDEGVRNTEETIDVHTKFLVIAEIKNPSEVSPSREEAATDTAKLLKILRDEARQSAVRNIRLNDFLAYIGYKPSRRLWRPNYSNKWPLKSGPRSGGVVHSTTERPDDQRDIKIYGRARRLYRPNNSQRRRSKSFSKNSDN